MRLCVERSTKILVADDSEEDYQRESPQKSRSRMTRRTVTGEKVNENNLNWVTQREVVVIRVNEVPEIG